MPRTVGRTRAAERKERPRSLLPGGRRGTASQTSIAPLSRHCSPTVTSPPARPPPGTTALPIPVITSHGRYFVLSNLTEGERLITSPSPLRRSPEGLSLPGTAPPPGLRPAPRPRAASHQPHPPPVRGTVVLGSGLGWAMVPFGALAAGNEPLLPMGETSPAMEDEERVPHASS